MYVVATPIGNLADISQRALDVLAGVDVIAAEDTRHSRKLLAHFGIDRPMLALHEHNEKEKSSAIIERLQQGQSIALISDAGTPLISDPGYPLVSACRVAGLPVVAVPGPSAIIAALSISGLPTDSFRFCGFPPRQVGKRRAFFDQFKHENATLVFYEASHRILESVRDMVEVFGHQRAAVVARELTKLFETVFSGSLAEAVDWLAADDNQRKGEFVVMLAGVESQADSAGISVDDLLAVLLQELPLKQAVSLAARISGSKKNELYQRALQLKSADE